MNSFLTPALYGIGVMLLTAAILTVAFRYIGRRTDDPDSGLPEDRHPGPAAEPAAYLEDSGRHHVPEEFLRVATFRLNADRIARAKVPPPGVGGWSPLDDDVRF